MLPQAQRAIWEKLPPAKELGFVLYGGTAIALRLGHRQSMDFDFFSSNDLEKDALLKRLPFLAGNPPIQDEKNTLTIIAENVKFSFFGGLPFGHYSPPETTSDQILDVASLDDLLALKTKVILQRSEARDYLDIAALLRHGMSLEKGLAIAEHMFRPQFAPMIAVRALTYFEDLSQLSKQDKTTLVNAVRTLGPLPNVEPACPSIAPPRKTPAPRTSKIVPKG